MKWLWTWDGRFFGYRDGEDIWTYKGKHIGKLDGTDVYDPQGKYLGELVSGERLVTCISKKNDRGYSFKPDPTIRRAPQNVDYAPYSMYAGYEDFPKLEDFD